jgi:hypothetical protein
MRWIFYGLLAVIILLAGPIWVLISGQVDMSTHWRNADHSRVGLAPLPKDHKPALVQIYAARAYNWRGLLGVHMWIAIKPTAAKQYTIYQVSGWNLYRHPTSLSIKHGMPDTRWYGHKPDLIDQLTGLQAEQAIPKIKQAIKQYPYKKEYSLWPGPNSNTFVAYVIRHVPELKTKLPTTAIGKDYLGKSTIFAWTPSGTGVQLSFTGMLGVSIGLYEGVEFNFFGLVFGVDVFPPAIKLPGINRVGF